MTSGTSVPATLKIRQTSMIIFVEPYETLKRFGLRTGTHLLSYLQAFRFVVTSTVEKGDPPSPSSEITIELVRIRTAQQYPILMPTLLWRKLATRERSYDSLLRCGHHLLIQITILCPH